MTITWLRTKLQARRNLVLLGLPLVALIYWLLLHRLAGLTPGLSGGELDASRAAVGWHGIYHQPLDLPLKLVRSVVFFVFPEHGQLLTRLPNVFFGALTIVTFGSVVRLWHGSRTALIATLLFACSAWTLHVSRLASFDVLYLWSLPALLLTQVLLHKYSGRPAIWYVSLTTWALLLYIPGMIWPLLFGWWLQRHTIAAAWRNLSGWRQRTIPLMLVVASQMLLLFDMTRPGQFISWLGLPAHWDTGSSLFKHFGGVPVHLFIRGPEYPTLWLARAPLLDMLALAMCALGIYFYARHWRASRSRNLGGLFAIGVVLVGLGGPVGLSLLVPLLYFAMATGIAFLVREWLQVFPYNPLVRAAGISLLAVAVSLSCVYNIRAYFVAWPNTAATRAAFHYHP